jgi:hypothetical protein
LDASDFKAAAFGALESIEIALDGFGLNAEQTQFELALWTFQQRLYGNLAMFHRGLSRPYG